MRKLLAVLAVAALGAAACASETDTGATTTSGPVAGDVVKVKMKGTMFVPSTLTVRKGQTVRFEFTNKDPLKHDAYVGDADAQDDHERAMRMMDAESSKNNDGEMMDEGHGDHADTDEGGITIKKRKHGTLTHTFAEKGTTYIGCHQPGHYAAGMRMTITVR